MSRDEILKLIDDNNAEIIKLERELRECYKQDRWLARLLPREPVVAYVGNEQVDQQWESEGGRMPDTLEAGWIACREHGATDDTADQDEHASHCREASSPFVGRKPSFNEFAERLTHSDIPPYKK